MSDPFDAALADLQRFIAVDIDGDGIPDGYTTADVIGGKNLSKSAGRRVSDTMNSLHMPYGPQERGGSGGYAVPAVSNFVTGTVGTMADALDNFQGGVRKGDPVKAGAAVAQGALTALPLTRYGAPLVASIPRTLATMGTQMSAADVARNGMPGAAAAGLTPEQERKKSELEARVAKGKWGSGAERRAIEGELGDLRRIETDFVTAENAARVRQQEADAAAKRERDNSMLTEARGARKDVLDRAPKPFHEEYPNWSRVQPFVPAALGFATQIPGALIEAVGSRRAAGRWRGAVSNGLATESPAALMDAAKLSAGYKAQFEAAPGLAKTYGPATAIGGVEGAVTANVPEAYNALALPSVNPEMTATQEFLKRLPPDHPEAVRARAALEDMPEGNAYQTAAAEHFRTPANILTKMGIGALEGAGGAAAAVTLGKGLGPSRSALPFAGTATLEGRMDPGYANALARVRTPGMGDEAVTNRLALRLRDELDAIPRPHPAPLPPQQQPALPPPPPPTPLPAPSGGATQPPGPGWIGEPVPQPSPQPQNMPLPGGGSRQVRYGVSQKSVVRPYIETEVAAGRPVPVYDEAVGQLTAAGVKAPAQSRLSDKLDSAREWVAEMRAKGVPDATISQVLGSMMARDTKGLPAIALGTGMGGNMLAYGGADGGGQPRNMLSGY